MNLEDIPLPDNVCDYTDRTDTYIPSTATNFESIGSLTDSSSVQSHSVLDCSSPVFASTSRQSENSLCFASISGVIYLEKNRAKLSSRVRQKTLHF